MGFKLILLASCLVSASVAMEGGANDPDTVSASGGSSAAGASPPQSKDPNARPAPSFYHPPTSVVRGVHAVPPQEEEVFDREGVSTQKHFGNSISPLIGMVDAQLSKGIAPSEICVVLDVDGTLTQNREPSGDPAIVKERGMARAVVKALVDKGITVVFSSAWPNFKNNYQKQGFIETMQRLMKLNFGIPDLFSSGEGYAGGETVIPGEDVCYYVKDGHVVSVTNAANRSFGDGYARAKYLAPFLFYPDQAKNLKVILFADDDLRNTLKFRNGINGNKHIYPALVHVDTLLLDGDYAVSEQNEELMRFVPQNEILAEATYTPPVDQSYYYRSAQPPASGAAAGASSSRPAVPSQRTLVRIGGTLVSRPDPNAVQPAAPSFDRPMSSRTPIAPGEKPLTPEQEAEQRSKNQASTAKRPRTDSESPEESQ